MTPLFAKVRWRTTLAPPQIPSPKFKRHQEWSKDHISTPPWIEQSLPIKPISKEIMGCNHRCPPPWWVTTTTHYLCPSFLGMWSKAMFSHLVAYTNAHLCLILGHFWRVAATMLHIQPPLFAHRPHMNAFHFRMIQPHVHAPCCCMLARTSGTQSRHCLANCPRN